ncbi:MAG: aspartate aminotransferase family protein [Promethearchaeota archaeon]|jgi:glutamate-1-semialdehyde 2,1-aminomutase
MEYEEIQEKMKIIRESPIRLISDKEMAKIRESMAKKCPITKKMDQKMRKHIAGGTEHQLTIKDPFVLTIKRSLGARMWDMDDNEYIDWLMSSGACILGHNFPPFKDELIRVYQDLDPNIYYNNEWEIKSVDMIKKYVPSIELMQYFQSGTEADMAALRIARAFTGKEKIIKFAGSYHGWCGQLCVDMHVPFSGAMEARGIPSSVYKNTIVVPLNDVNILEESLKKWMEKRSGVAAVLVDPLGSDAGGIATKKDWLSSIRELCDKYGVLLIFDEVITGFRLGMGGAQEYFNVRPDLSVFGKLLTHGFPGSGAVGGRNDIMTNITIDVEPGGTKAFVGGTLRGNPLTAAATYWTLKFMEQHSAHKKAKNAADDLVKKLNLLFEKDGRPFFAHNIESIVHFETFSPLALDLSDLSNVELLLKRNEAVNRIATALLAQGIITKYGNRGFTCMQHTKEDNDKFIEAFENVLKKIPR